MSRQPHKFLSLFFFVLLFFSLSITYACNSSSFLFVHKSTSLKHYRFIHHLQRKEQSAVLSSPTPSFFCNIWQDGLTKYWLHYHCMCFNFPAHSILRSREVLFTIKKEAATIEASSGVSLFVCLFVCIFASFIYLLNYIIRCF